MFSLSVVAMVSILPSPFSLRFGERAIGPSESLFARALVEHPDRITSCRLLSVAITISLSFFRTHRIFVVSVFTGTSLRLRWRRRNHDNASSSSCIQLTQYEDFLAFVK